MVNIKFLTTISFVKFVHQLCLVMAFVFFSSTICCACVDEIPLPQKLGNETTCPICKTTNLSEDKWQAQIIYPDFTLFAFDTYNCMFTYAFSPENHLSIAAIWVKDSISDEWITGNRAYFSIVKKITQSSPPVLTAFKTKEDAQGYADNNTGMVRYYPQITKKMLNDF